MKSYTQLIEEILGEDSLGHQRIGRLAKSGNLSHAHLDKYVKKHIKRGGGWGVRKDDSNADDVQDARDHVETQIHLNINHYNNNKHKAKLHYSPDNVDKLIALSNQTKKTIKPYETDWSGPGLQKALDWQSRNDIRYEGYKRALRRKGPDAEQYVNNEIKRQANRAARSIVDIESLGNRQDTLTKHHADLESPAMSHPDPEVRTNTRNIRTDLQTQAGDVAIQALDKQRNFDKLGGKLDALAVRRNKLRAFTKAKEIDAKNPMTRNKDLPSPLGHGNF
jgi:hypothetical protein